VEHYQLVRTAVVEPFIRERLPRWGEVDQCWKTGRRSSDNVVAVEQRTRNGFTDAIDIWRSSDEGDDEANSGREQGGIIRTPNQPT